MKLSMHDALQRVLDRLLGPNGAQDTAQPREEMLDGEQAIAALELCLADVGAAGGATDSSGSGRAFAAYCCAHANVLGRRVEMLNNLDARDVVRGALGAALAGARTTAFASGHELGVASGVLDQAVSRHAPLVVHLQTGWLAGPGAAAATGHGPYHAVSETGCMQLFAHDAQDAVDLALVGRMAAELALNPVVVAIDDETARLQQRVRMPSAGTIRNLIGQPDAPIESPTPAQIMTFGPTRVRVPVWHDLDRPALHGALHGPESWAAHETGQSVFFARHAAELLARSMAQVSRLAGRRIEELSTHQMDGARLVLIAQGSAVATAMATADQLRSTSRLKVGVIGVRTFRPFPWVRLAELLRGRRDVVVLERTDGLLAAEPPLLREIRACAQRSLENGRFKVPAQADQPRWSAKELPRFYSAVYGQGGLALRRRDLEALCRRLPRDGQQVVLGVAVGGSSSEYPKRQVMLDRLRHVYPEAHGASVIGDSEATRRPQTLGLAVCRRSGLGAEGVAGTVAELIWMLYPKRAPCASRARAVEAWGEPLYDELVVTDREVAAASDGGQPVDLLLITHASSHARWRRVDRLLTGGAALLEVVADQQANPEGLLSAEELSTLEDRRACIYTCESEPQEPEDRRRRRLAGAVLGVAAAEGHLELGEARLRSVATKVVTTLLVEEPDEIVDALVSGFTTIRQVKLSELTKAPDERAVDAEVPATLRALEGSADLGAPVDSLADFWSRVAVPHEAGDSAEVDANPFSALDRVPALTAFARARVAAQTLPVVDTQRCTGCGRCWTVCPDAAIGAIALTPRQLLEAGLTLVKQGGRDAESLRPILAKLAARTVAKLQRSETKPVALRTVVEAPFSELLDKGSFDRGRARVLAAAFEAVTESIGHLGVICTDTLFGSLEAKQRGSGALLSLAVNPDGCKGCGLCAEVCQPKAIQMGPRSQDVVLALRRQWRIWERIPDTSGETIALLAKQGSLDPLAALLLSRHCLFALVPGDGAEAGSGAKIALRAVLATAEHELQRRFRPLIEDLQQVRDDLAQRTRDLLAAGLPAGDVKALARGLEGLEVGHIGLGELVDRIEGVVQGQRVDVARLRDAVDIGKELADLHWRLWRGSHGLGRSRYSLALSVTERLRGLAVYPYNPFQAPATVDFVGGVLPRGLLLGQIRQAMGPIRALRRARLMLESPAELPLQSAELDRLSWEQLDQQERLLCPPLIVVDTDGNAGLWAAALDSDLPVKMILLSGESVPGAGTGSGADALQLIALGWKRAVVAQTSIAAPGHLVQSVARALSYAGPAIIRIHAPSPTLEEFASDRTIEQAERSLQDRSFPLFLLDPEQDGTLGTRLSLDGNPDASQATGASPEIEVDGVAARNQAVWRVLQELAGTVTPFTVQVKTEIEAELRGTHQEALQRLAGQHDQEMAQQRSELSARVAREVGERLLVLAGYGSSGEATAVENSR